MVRRLLLPSKSPPSKPQPNKSGKRRAVGIAPRPDPRSRDQVQQHSRCRAPADDGQDAGLEAEDGHDSRSGQHQRGEIDGSRNRPVDRHSGDLDLPYLPEQGVQREPDREVEDDADDRRRDGAQRRRQGAVAAQ